MKKIIKNIQDNEKSSYESDNTFDRISDSLRKIQSTTIEKNTEYSFSALENSLKSYQKFNSMEKKKIAATIDKDIVKYVVSKNGSHLKYISEDLKNDTYYDSSTPEEDYINSIDESDSVDSDDIDPDLLDNFIYEESLQDEEQERVLKKHSKFYTFTKKQTLMQKQQLYNDIINSFEARRVEDPELNNLDKFLKLYNNDFNSTSTKNYLPISEYSLKKPFILKRFFQICINVIEKHLQPNHYLLNSSKLKSIIHNSIDQSLVNHYQDKTISNHIDQLIADKKYVDVLALMNENIPLSTEQSLLVLKDFHLFLNEGNQNSFIYAFKPSLPTPSDISKIPSNIVTSLIAEQDLFSLLKIPFSHHFRKVTQNVVEAGFLNPNLGFKLIDSGMAFLFKNTKMITHEGFRHKDTAISQHWHNLTIGLLSLYKSNNIPDKFSQYIPSEVLSSLIIPKFNQSNPNSADTYKYLDFYGQIKKYVPLFQTQHQYIHDTNSFTNLHKDFFKTLHLQSLLKPNLFSEKLSKAAESINQPKGSIYKHCFNSEKADFSKIIDLFHNHKDENSVEKNITQEEVLKIIKQKNFILSKKNISIETFEQELSTKKLWDIPYEIQNISLDIIRTLKNFSTYDDESKNVAQNIFETVISHLDNYEQVIQLDTSLHDNFVENFNKIKDSSKEHLELVQKSHVKNLSINNKTVKKQF